jgi:hypothetical protein
MCPKIDVMERECKNLKFEKDLNGALLCDHLVYVWRKCCIQTCEPILSWCRTWPGGSFLGHEGPSVVVTRALFTCELGQEWRITSSRGKKRDLEIKRGKGHEPLAAGSRLEAGRAHDATRFQEKRSCSGLQAHDTLISGQPSACLVGGMEVILFSFAPRVLV